jgi:type II secretory pathway pseudopilin PulG
VSLIEAIAALAIVGATSVGALAVAGAGVRTAEQARRAHEVQALVREQLARVELARDEELLLLPDSLAAGPFAPPFDDYRWEMAVRPDARYNGLFRIELVVRWDDGAFVTESAIYRRPARRVLEGE